MRHGCVAERPCRARRAYYFRAWIRRLERLGFRVEWRVLNAADYGDATTRRRFFLIGRRDGEPIRWPTPTHSKEGGGDLFGGGRKRWRGAREVIDWSIRCRSIFTRKKPLSPNTLARIYTGAKRFGWPQPFLVVLRQHMSAQSLDDPLPTITAGGSHLALAQPFVLPQHAGGAAREPETPLPTITTDGAHALVAPYYGQSQARPATAPLPTVTTKDRFGLAVPVVAEGEHAFMVPAFGEREGQAPRVHDLEKPAPTICATGRLNLVEARGVDVLFRMLRPHELAAAMGFPSGEDGYQFAGNDEEVKKQIGNAVPVNTAAALVGACLGVAS